MRDIASLSDSHFCKTNSLFLFKTKELMRTGSSVIALFDS
jgi:hypothetical protein